MSDAASRSARAKKAAEARWAPERAKKAAAAERERAKEQKKAENKAERDAKRAKARAEAAEVRAEQRRQAKEARTEAAAAAKKEASARRTAEQAAQKDAEKAAAAARVKRRAAASKSRAGGPYLKRGALSRGVEGDITHFRYTRGAFRAIRHAPGVAHVLHVIAEDIQTTANAGLAASARYAPEGEDAFADVHFLFDGGPARETNRRGSYRTSVRTHTARAVVANHEEHLLAAALADQKSKGLNL